MGYNGWILVHIWAVVMDEFYVHIWVVINLLCMVKYFISMSTWFMTKWSLFCDEMVTHVRIKNRHMAHQKITHGPTKMSHATSPASMDDDTWCRYMEHYISWQCGRSLATWHHLHGSVHVTSDVAVISATSVGDTTWTKLDNLWWKWWRFSFYHRGEMEMTKVFRRG